MTPHKTEILRERHRILAQNGAYHILITADDRAGEIGDEYAEKLLEWAMTVWDWAAVVTEEEGRGEGIAASESGSVRYTLDNDDLNGLFGGEYADSPGPLPGFVEDSDSWPGLGAHAWIPRSDFSEDVQKELFEEEGRGL